MLHQDQQDDVFEALTLKQREVLELLADNRTTKEIAGALDVSESAINQRIDTLRQRLGGITRSELVRRYRSSNKDERSARGAPARNATCQSITGENLRLASREEPLVAGRMHDPPGRFYFADAQILGSEHPWTEPSRWVGPRWLYGKHASWFRILAMLGIVVLIIASLVLVLTAAQVLTETLGG